MPNFLESFGKGLTKSIPRISNILVQSILNDKRKEEEGAERIAGVEQQSRQQQVLFNFIVQD